MHTIYIINVLMIAINAFVVGMLWESESDKPLLYIINLAAVFLNIVTVTQVLIHG